MGIKEAIKQNKFDSNQLMATVNIIYTANWLRDQNERVLLMGALAELFAYVQEDDQAQKYLQVFKSEIAELNEEDAKRNASGGNLQVNFNGRGLI